MLASYYKSRKRMSEIMNGQGASHRTMQPPPTEPEAQEQPATKDVSVSDSEGDHADDSQDSAGHTTKKRKRNVKISCELCKQRKVKCDRAEPSCGWCARNNRVCVYLERKKPGLANVYVRELEEKINRVEAVLHSLGRRVEDHIADHDARAVGTAPFPQPSFGLTPRSDIPRSLYTDSTTVERSPTVDSAWTTQKGQDSLSAPLDAISLSSVFDDRPQFAKPRAYTSSTLPLERPTALRKEDDLPPPDLLFDLVDLFFKHINPWSPILDRATTMGELFPHSRPHNESQRTLLEAIVVTTLRFSKDPRLTPFSRKQYHDTLKAKVLLYSLGSSDIQVLQALLILTIDAIGTDKCAQGKNLVAILACNVEQLDLGLEKSVYMGVPSYVTLNGNHKFAQMGPSTWIQDEGRRRLTWMIYMLDRYNTVAYCSSFGLPDASMKRRLPTTFDLFSRNEPVETRWPREGLQSSNSIPATNLGSFSYHCEVVSILSDIQTFLKRPVDLYSAQDFTLWRSRYQSLDFELNTWLHSLPGEYGQISQLCHTDPGSRISNWVQLHAGFVAAVIRLHSAAAYPTTSSTTASHSLFRPSYNAMQRCLDAAESLREITQDTVNNAMLDLLGPPFAFSLWTSARLLLVHAATLDSEVDPKIRFFISTLESMGAYWQVASTYAAILSRVVDEGQQSIHSFAGNNIANSSTAKSFKEMRKTAYELNILLNQTQKPGTIESRIHTPAANELEYLEVFDFFNYPLSTSPVTDSASTGSMAQAQAIIGAAADHAIRSPSFAMPTRESDWLDAS